MSSLGTSVQEPARCAGTLWPPDAPARGSLTGAPAWRAAAPLAALLLLLLGLWLGTAAAAPWVHTELRRAVIAREMAHSGDYVLPHYGGERSLTKPPLHYALQAAAMSVVGETRLAARLPSLASIALLAGAVWLFGRWLGFGRAQAGFAMLLFASHPLIGQLATSAEIDGTFTAWTGMSLFALARAAGGGAAASRWCVASGVLAGLAAVTKGPIVAMFLVPAWLPLLRRDRRAGSLRWWPVWLIPAVAPLAAWGVCLATRGAFGELLGTGSTETVGRLADFELSRLLRIPLDYASFALLLLPLLALLPWSRRVAPRASGRDAAMRVLLYGALGGLALFVLSPHRSTRYLMPAFAPLFVWLCERTWPTLVSLAPVWSRWRRFVFAGALAAAPVVALLAPPPVTFAPIACLLIAAAACCVRVPHGWAWICAAIQLVVVGDVAARKDLQWRDRRATAQVVASALGEGRAIGWGHVPAELVWELGNAVHADERGARDRIDTDWVVFHEGRNADDFELPPVRYEQRRRISFKGGVLVVARVVR